MDAKSYIASLSFDPLNEQHGGSKPHNELYAPTFNADREIAERIARLHRVWGYATMHIPGLSYKYQRFWAGAIVELTDTKGTLHVTWRDEVSRVMFEGVILGAWEAHGDHMSSHSIYGVA